MESRRQKVIDAVVAALGVIQVANGYNTDAGVNGDKVPKRGSSSGATLPLVLVHSPREVKDDQAISDQYHCTMTLEIFAAAHSAEDGFVEEDVDLLVADVERALLAQKNAEPPLGVAGCIDIRLQGHTKLEARGDEIFVGAVIDATVEYRHDIDNPATYYGESA